MSDLVGGESLDTADREPAEGDEPSSPAGDAPRRRWPPTVASAFGLALGVWGLSIGLRPLGDNSLFTHLATGRLILDGGIPTADPYSYTAPGEAWTVQSWLASAVLAGSERVAGAAGPQLVFGVLTGVLALLAWMLTRPARTLIPRLGIAALILAVGEAMWSERPLLIGLVGLALVLLAADDRLDPRWLVPVMWVWVNSHGSFPLAAGVLVLLALGRRLDGERPDTELRALAWTIGGTLLGVVGPLGLRVLLFPLVPLTEPGTFEFIVEWQAPTFTSMSSRLYLLQVVLAVLALVRRPSYRAMVPTAVFLVASLIASRNIAPASLVIGYAMSFGLADVGRLDGRERNVISAALMVALAGLAALLIGFAAVGTHYDYNAYPVSVLTWARDAGVEVTDQRVVGPDYMGNWFEGRYGEDAAVFIDDRYDMYPAEVVDDYKSLVVAGPEWSEVLDRYEVDAVIWQTNEPLSRVLGLDPEWRVAYQGDGWIYACRRGAPTCPG